MTRRISQLLVGLFLYGFGIALMVRGAIGVAPWDVLPQGIALQTGLPFGLVTNIVGAVVLLLWIPIRQKPGIGTVLNVLLVGPSAQVGLWVIPEVDDLFSRVVLFAGGLAMIAHATGLYIGARFGPGPRDRAHRARSDGARDRLAARRQRRHRNARLRAAHRSDGRRDDAPSSRPRRADRPSTGTTHGDACPMIAMMIALAALSLWAVIGTVELVARDGYGRVPTRTEWLGA
jgi:hypothetical protein